MGKLIVIEGLDGSGKSTQLGLLPDKLLKKGIESKAVSFPDYDDPSSTLVKMYLSGDFGNKPGDVNAYAASIFYAVDRYASYKRHWGEYYKNDGLILCGRYVTSNAVHQTAKLPREEWEPYLKWLYNLEYEKICIPKPDLVIFLDMPPEVSQKMLTTRYGGDECKKDIHERDVSYLENCRKSALFAAEFSGWKIIKCAENGAPRTIDSISDDIFEEVLKLF
ncbi:MAG: deoxynucleoside kinase [Oscillospiraceae bacterium]|nr:deoxynucleoside kinase [Oscillospiraceae bacterium]